MMYKNTINMQEGGDPVIEAIAADYGDVPLDINQMSEEELLELERLGAIGSAPMAAQAQELALSGRGPDTQLVHAEIGDVIVPPTMMLEDPEIESFLETKFEKFDIDPASRVVGAGIASLNPQTGLEEFGFFKKVFKSIKKVVKKVAPVAQFIPGPWQPIAALYTKGKTVVDVAKGDANPLALLSVAGPLRTGPSIGDSFNALKGMGQSGTFFGGLGQAFKDIPGALQGGIGSLFQDPLGTIGGIFKSQNPADYVENADGSFVNKITGEVLSADQYAGLMSRAGSMITGYTQGLQGALFGTEGLAGGVQEIAPGVYQDRAGNQYTLEQLQSIAAGGAGGMIPGMGGMGGMGGMTGMGGGFGQMAGSGIGGLLGGLGGGGGGLGDILKLGGIGAAAYAIGKLAADEAERDRGVPLTPSVTMGPTGRYNIEAEIARRMGQEAPDPVEFGLLPAGTFPELSGGKPVGYAEGGNVAPAEFPRMNGYIGGPGTEKSDDIPAMLSDGEFVMTGQAVRGAGSFKLEKNDGGIVSLIPSAEEDRERGTNLMYEMMDLFSNYARPRS